MRILLSDILRLLARRVGTFAAGAAVGLGATSAQADQLSMCLPALAGIALDIIASRYIRGQR